MIGVAKVAILTSSNDFWGSELKISSLKSTGPFSKTNLFWVWRYSNTAPGVTLQKVANQPNVTYYGRLISRISDSVIKCDYGSSFPYQVYDSTRSLIKDCENIRFMLCNCYRGSWLTPSILIKLRSQFLRR